MPVGADGGAHSSAGQPTPDSEQLLNRLVTAESGGYYDIVKLRGAGVPADLDLYFCKNRFAVVQVRVKTLVAGEAHEYPRDLGQKGGIHDLRCQRCAHELQVKVQPPLGFLNLVKPPPYSSAQQVDMMLHKLYAVAGLYYLLHAFQRDPTRESAPVVPEAPDATRHVGRLAKDQEVLRLLLDKCPVFKETQDAGAPSLKLVDGSRPKTRGMLLKAILEVKMLLVIVVEHFQADEGQFTRPQLQQFHNFLIEIHEDCCSGGASAQYVNLADSWESLKALVCGPSVAAMSEVVDNSSKLSTADAWKLLQECVANIRNSVIPRLQQKGQHTADLELPSTDFRSAGGGAEFKLRYARIWRRAIDAYLFDLVHSSQYPKGPAAGMAMMRNQWTRPDRALQMICPSVDLDKAIDECKAELEPFLADKAAKRLNGVGKDGLNFNPRGSTGLVNPGENLCAANALLQLLFSAQPFRDAVLGAPELPVEGGGTLEADARQLVTGTRRLFTEMDHPDRASTCAREVAAALYGKELGQQQDCDELMHRLSLLLQDGLSEVPNKPCGSLQQAFRRLFVGVTYEVRLKASESGNNNTGEECGFSPIYPESEAVGNKQFLSIPVQQGNETVTQALAEFTSWSSTGGTDIAWTQERFRTVPPFLCFASRQVSAFEWEESLNLTPFVASASSSMQKKRYERSRALQMQFDLKDALQHLAPASKSLAKANILGDGSLSTNVNRLSETLERVESHLVPVADRISELDRSIGDGFDEPSLDDFLHGLVDTSVIQSVFRGVLGADTVKQLADLLLDGGSSSDTLQDLVQKSTLTKVVADGITAKLKQRWDEHHAHMYDLHSIIVYQGLGQFGHYVAFIRQSDNKFLCFDDEQVSEHEDAAGVRTEISARGSEGYPASVRMVVYSRRGAVCAEPLELGAPQAVGATNGAAVNGTKHGIAAERVGQSRDVDGVAGLLSEAKRRRTS